MGTTDTRVGVGEAWHSLMGCTHIADDALRVELAVEEDDGAAGKEEPGGHEVLGLCVGWRLEPGASDDDHKGGDSRPTDPRVDRAVDPLLGVRVQVAGLDGREHEIVDAAGQA